MDFEQKAGMDVASFYDFIVRILNDVGPGTPQRERCFTLNDILAHLHPMVVHTIQVSETLYRLRYVPPCPNRN